MKRTEIEKLVNERIIALAFFELTEDLLTPEDSLQNDLGMDSLDKTELLIDLEQTFTIRIPLEAEEAIQTVKDLYDLIETLVNLKENEKQS